MNCEAAGRFTAGWITRSGLHALCGRPLVAGIGLCLGNIFNQTLGAVEGNHVKCADVFGLGENAYTSKSNQNPESSPKMCPASGLQ